jgi:hypothetical protein
MGKDRYCSFLPCPSFVSRSIFLSPDCQVVLVADSILVITHRMVSMSFVTVVRTFEGNSGCRRELKGGVGGLLNITFTR